MKNKKILKSAALALGTVASVAAPIAAVVSCGSSTDYSHKVVIKTTWAASGEQINALKEAVAAYNKQKAPDDYEVVVNHVEGGYGTAFTNDEKDIKIGHMSSVADAYIDYPDTIGRLKSIKGKDYSLNLSGDVSKSQFDTRFMEDSQETLPLALSTEMATIDMPVLGYLIEGVASNLKNPTFKGTVADALKAWQGSSDRDAIQKIWGKVNTSATKFEVTDAIFTNYTKLFDFATKAQAAFDTPSAHGGAQDDHHVVGDDSPANLSYIMYASENATDGKTNKDIFTKTEESFIDNDAVKANFKTTLGEITNAVAGGGLILNGGGAYSSSDLTYHRMAIAIGSTAGYNHNYIKVGGDKTTLLSGANKIELSKYAKELVLDGTKTNIVTDDKYANKILSSGTKDYSVVVSPDDLSKLLAKAKTPDNEIFELDALKDTQKTALEAAGAVVANGNYYSHGKAIPKTIVVIPTSKVTKVSDNGADTLNKSEAKFIPAPNTSGTKSDAVKFALAQGPSFVGVKHGDKKDTELAKFLKWFYDADSRLQGDATTSSSSVIQSFAKAASYVTPTTDFTSIDWNKDKYGGNSMVVEAFKSANVNAYTNPVTEHSKSIREQIETSMKEGLQASFHQGGSMSVEDIYTNIVGALKRDWN